MKEVKPLEHGGNVKTITMAEKKFKPHAMYKGEEAVEANTHEKHLELKDNGFGHDSPAPFKLREVNSPMKCWKTHKKVGMKKSPSGRTKNGKIVMVNDCKKK